MYGLSNHEVSAGEADFDGDGLSDAAEFAALASDPTKTDSDDDGLTDGKFEALKLLSLILTVTDSMTALKSLQAQILSIQTLTMTDMLMELRSVQDLILLIQTAYHLHFSLTSTLKNEEGNVVDMTKAGNRGWPRISWWCPGTSGLNYPAGERLPPHSVLDGWLRWIKLRENQLWSRADGAGVEVLASADFTGDDPANDDVRREASSSFTEPTKPSLQVLMRVNQTSM